MTIPGETSNEPIPTRAHLRALADVIGVHPNKRLGQNFLVTASVHRAIVADAQIDPGDVVLEIGPGFGSLSIAILEALGPDGRLAAVELDRGLAAYLRDRFRAEPRFQLIEGDCLDHGRWSCALEDNVDLWTQRQRTWRVCANLPYAAGTPWLAELWSREPLPTRFAVLLQREVAERIVSGVTAGGHRGSEYGVGTKAYGPLSVKFALGTSGLRITRRITPDAFWPKPEIDSAVIAADVVRPADLDWALLAELLDAGFAARRKTLRASIKNTVKDTARCDVLLRRLEQGGIDLGLRAEQVPPHDWATAARIVKG
jgi:16S rRNA (adenine1518-N6/adenine1519-N6)-dimethyltransferase